MSESREYADRYFRQAATLRLCLEYNRDDYAFAEQGGRIVYVFDANVVRFFIDPERESDHVVAFHSQESPDYAEATALIAAEFLFSRELSGQDGSPAFFAPSHGEEIEHFLNELTGQATPATDAVPQETAEAAPGDEANALPLAAEKVAELRALTEDLSAGRIGRAAAVQRLRQLVPDAARLLIGSHWSWSTQLLRLYDEDKIRSLALHSRATLDILKPDVRLRDAWTRRLMAGGGDNQSLRAERDAEALVQVMLLDEEAAQEEGQPIRYVLVTADSHLFDTYARWYWGQEQAELRRFVLRLPLQYAPILNALEMPNGLNSDRLTADAQTALDSLFASLSRVDSDYAKKLSFYRTMAGASDRLLHALQGVFGENPVSFSDHLLRRFRNIRRMWHECFKTGVVLNANLLRRRQQEFEFLADCLRDNLDLRREIYDTHRRNLQSIKDAHAVFSIQLQLATIDKDKAEDPDRAGSPVLFAEAALPRLLGDDTLQEALEKLGDAGPTMLARLDDSPPEFDVMLLGAAMAHRSEKWEVAVLFSQRALELSAQTEKAEPSEEAALIFASATRLAASETPEPLNVERLILAVSHTQRAQRLFSARGDLLGVARAAYERNALLLLTLAWRAVRHAEVDPPATAADAVHESLAALSLLEDLTPEQKASPLGRLAPELARGLHANVLRAVALTVLGHGDHDLLRLDVDDETVARALAQVSSPVRGAVTASELLAARVRLGTLSTPEALAASTQMLEQSGTGDQARSFERELLEALYRALATAASPTRAEVLA